MCPSNGVLLASVSQNQKFNNMGVAAMKVVFP